MQIQLSLSTQSSPSMTLYIWSLAYINCLSRFMLFEIVFKVNFDIIEMLETLNRFPWEKFAVWFLYICAQILVFAALLLTTTNMVAHTIFILLTGLLYFVTALRNPGYYQGVVQPNLEDAELSVSKSRPHLSPPIPHRNLKDELGVATFRSQREDKKVQRSFKMFEEGSQVEDVKADLQQVKSKKKTSIDEKMENKVTKDGSDAVNEKGDLPVDGKKSALEGGRFNFLQAAKSMFSLFKSKKENRPPEETSEKESKSSKSSSPSKRSQSKPDSIPQKRSAILKKEESREEQDCEEVKQVTKQPKITVKIIAPSEEEYVSSTLKEKGCNSAIGKQDFCRAQIESQFQKQQQTYPLKSVVKKIENIKRYCRMCESYQPLRVKHCYSCQRCVTTFDHHCPWMGCCIGEKNKVFFIAYLFFQNLQLLTMVIDLIVCLAGEHLNSSSVGILLMAALLFLILLASLLGFHTYLLVTNLTTWQLLKWNKIEYLNLFDRSKLSSPFSKGFINNIKQLVQISFSPEPKNWMDQVSQDLSKYVVRKGRTVKSQIHMLDSDRRPFRSQKVV